MKSEDEEKTAPTPSLQNTQVETQKRIINILQYEKWRDDGKYDHKKRDIEKKQNKVNAVIKAKKKLNTESKPSDGG